jgi:hypothetical protein
MRAKEIERDPEWDEQNRNFEVRLRGTSRDGRITRLVLALRFYGENKYVTIVDLGRG